MSLQDGNVRLQDAALQQVGYWEATSASYGENRRRGSAEDCIGHQHPVVCQLRYQHLWA